MADPLVTTDWLSEHLDDPDVVVLDCTASTVLRPAEEGGGLFSVSGRPDYDAGHIPGAGFADLIEDLADRESELAFAWPTPEALCAALGALGVGDDSTVVLYDGNGSRWAARVWWMLRWVGFDRAVVLDGGVTLWAAEGRPLSAEAVARPERRLTPSVRPGLVADRDEVFAAIGNRWVRLIDALVAPHYSGDVAFVSRPGHVPGATSIPARGLVDETGRYLPLKDLASQFPGDRDTRVITYCAAGINAAADAFVMTRLGFTNVAVYAASLQEWAADPANPLVVGGV